MAITSSLLGSAANNIVNFGVSSKGVLPKMQKDFDDFSSFLSIRKIELEQVKLPSKRKVKELGNLNIVNTFGSIGGLLSSLFNGALDIGGLISGFFPGKGEKIGKPPKSGGAQPKPKLTGNKLKLGGIRGLGIINTLFAGIDFAQGISSGESVGKAGSGAAGSLVGGVAGGLAGTLLAGAIGQALVPVPGLGFVLGAALGTAGGFLGGWTGDRIYDSISGAGRVEQKQKEKLQNASRSKLNRTSSTSIMDNSFDMILKNFEQSVSKFVDFVENIGSLMGVDENNPYDEPAEYPEDPEISPEEGYGGPVDGTTFFPLPGGDVGTNGIVGKVQAFGAPRWHGPHQGLDMTNQKGALDAPVVAYKTGKVIYITGKGHDTGMAIDHGDGTRTRYFHITPLVGVGDIVYGGQQIAKLVPAGRATHLHFEVIKGNSAINPLNAGIGPGGSAIRLPSPLAKDKAKQNSDKNNKENKTQGAGVDIHLPKMNESQKPPTVASSQPASRSQPVRSTPIKSTSNQLQSSILPQNVMASAPRPLPKIEKYPIYSEGKTYIIEKQSIISATSGGGGRSAPAIVPVGGGGGSGDSVVVVADGGAQVLNSVMKSILLTSLSST